MAKLSMHRLPHERLKLSRTDSFPDPVIRLRTGVAMTWQMRDAKARFSEFLEASLRDGPQIVTRQGVEAAVLVSIEEWRRLKHAARPTLKQLLLAPHARFEISTPRRGGLRRRP